MDFFEQRDRAKEKTRPLVVAFFLAVLAYIVAANVVIASLYVLFNTWNPFHILTNVLYLFGEALVYPRHFFALIWNPHVAIFCTLGVLLSIALGCFYKFRCLARGGAAVAEMLGGRKIAAETTIPEERTLRLVVEEMAVAALLPVPEIYLLDYERGINAFAAGHTHDDIAIGVTFGAVKLLTRDELQGMIAHEFSHVLNGDTRLNLKLMVVVHGIFWPTLAGRILVHNTTEQLSMLEDTIDLDQLRVLLLPLAFLLLAVGWIGSPLVRLIKRALCREREWLADAEAVQFTRYPTGIEGALKKIGGLLKAGRLDTPGAEVASHLYFVNCRHEPWFDFLSTHPPLAKRILAIDPAFNGEFQHIPSLPRPEVAEAAKYDRVYRDSLDRARKARKSDEA